MPDESEPNVLLFPVERITEPWPDDDPIETLEYPFPVPCHHLGTFTWDQNAELVRCAECKEIINPLVALKRVCQWIHRQKDRWDRLHEAEKAYEAARRAERQVVHCHCRHHKRTHIGGTGKCRGYKGCCKCNDFVAQRDPHSSAS